MAHAHSFGATLKNNKTENEAIRFLLKADTRFRLPKKEERKEILNKLGLPASFVRAYDLVLLPDGEAGDILSVEPEKWILVELKTTQKKLSVIPNGFFFGATANEFDLAERLGDRYRFCFVSLHAENAGYKLLSLSELEKLIKTKRIQYQINLM